MDSYTSSTTYSMIIVALFITILLAIAIYYIVKRRVESLTARAMEANNMMQQALSQSDHLIVALNLKDNKFYNIHDSRLPATGLPISDAASLVHPDDREAYFSLIERLRSGEKQEDTLDYRFNVVYDGSEPIWHITHNHAILEYDKQGNPSHIICIMNDVTDDERIQQQDEEMANKYENLFEESIIGISFYNADGYLIDCNRMMREICNFEDRYDSVFFDSCIFDFAQFNINREHVEENWLCINLELPKRNLNKYLEVHVHPINDEKGKLKYIAMGVRDISRERDLYLQSKKNNIQIRQANDEIHRYEEELRYLLENSKMHVWRSSFEKREIEFLTDLHNPVARMSIEEFAQRLQTNEQELAVKRLMLKTEEREHNNIVITRPYKNLLVNDDKIHWYNMNSIPSYDDNGQQTGYFGLIRDTTRLIEEQEMLRRETERANDSDRMKSVFLANMTHEIRTPLNAIVGFSDLLTAIESSDDKKEMIRIIRNNCDMLLRLINDFLAISSIESNGLEITPADIDFAHEFNDYCQSLAQRVVEPSVQFIKDNPYKELHTRLDKDRIGQVITNFVTNAVKYTQQGHIKVGYRIIDKESQTMISSSPADDSHPTELYIYCEDTGFGIPQEDQERIFERFVKLNDYIQGTGLGLSICKIIAERCGGQIGVDSEIGKGSTFWMRIPCEVKDLKANTD